MKKNKNKNKKKIRSHAFASRARYRVIREARHSNEKKVKNKKGTASTKHKIIKKLQTYANDTRTGTHTQSALYINTAANDIAASRYQVVSLQLKRTRLRTPEPTTSSFLEERNRERASDRPSSRSLFLSSSFAVHLAKGRSSLIGMSE